MKQSGFGRELGMDAIKEYTQVSSSSGAIAAQPLTLCPPRPQIKAVHFNYGEELSWPISG